jgi:diguanylate cyclase (GGDEF)-like protein
MATIQVRPMTSASSKPFLNRAVSRKQSDAPRPPSEPLEGEGSVAQAFLSAEPVIITDMGDVSRPLANREAWLATGLRSCIALPLIIDGTAVGVIQLHSDETDVFRRDEISLLRQVTGNIAFALQHMHSEENARYLEYFDPRTALANRTLFLQRLEQMVRTSDDAQSSLSLLVLDLTGLTVVNDGLGHHAGDLLLQLVAERLKNEFGDSKQLCHLGSGRYAVASLDRVESNGGAIVRERVASLFDEPFVIDEQEVRASVKAGIAQYPTDAIDSEQLLQRAQSALEHAKRSGHQYLKHSPSMNTEASARLSLTNQLRQYVAEQRFDLFYQPTLNCASGQVEGVEALLRWPVSESESISPGVFIPMLETLGLIDSVGAWVMQRALRDTQAHLISEVPQLKIAVNVSPLSRPRPLPERLSVSSLALHHRDERTP